MSKLPSLKSRDVIRVLHEIGFRIVGIEIMDASRHLLLEKLLPVKYEVPKQESI